MRPSAQAQGLDPRITDPLALAKVARLIRLLSLRRWSPPRPDHRAERRIGSAPNTTEAHPEVHRWAPNWTERSVADVATSGIFAASDRAGYATCSDTGGQPGTGTEGSNQATRHPSGVECIKKCWARTKVPGCHGRPVRTSLGAPRWAGPPVLFPWPAVYPYGAVRGGLARDDFTRRYRHRLHRHTARILELQELREGYGDLVLYCFEAPGVFCHRQVPAGWLAEHLGEPVEQATPR